MPENPEKSSAAREYPPGIIAVAVFFAAPLLFFTDLTRNPYYFQITLLNISLLAGGALLLAQALKSGAWPLPRNILYVPLSALLAVMALSFVRAYFSHAPFFRPSMLSEFTRAGIFVAVNCVLAFLLAQRCGSGTGAPGRPAGAWLAFIALWGAMWFLFHDLKAPPSRGSLMAAFWDPYGGTLWLAGAGIAWYLVREVSQDDVLHLAMAGGALASCYGALQYFGVELVWPRLLNPYGNRSVSTFGNPNFISSYLVLLLPFALAYLLAAKKTAQRLLYAFLLLSYSAMLLSSLTRSSWIGAAAGLGALFAFGEYRRKLAQNKKFLSWFFGAALFLVILWPAQSLKPFSSGLSDRLTEGFGKAASLSSLSLGAPPERVYHSFHQRLLIWSSAWQMGLENPMLGKGWGLFENFYPFYQGPLLLRYPGIRALRTHANNAHNEFLEIFSQLGLIGLGIYAWLFAVLFTAFARHRAASGEEEKYRTAPFAAAVIGIFADNMFNVSLHFAVPALLFWWIMGAFSRRLSGSGAPAPGRLGAGGRAAAAVLLLLCAAGAWYWTGQFTRETRYFRGFKAMRRNDFAGAAAELKKAHEASAREVNNNYELANAFVRTEDVSAAKWAYGEALRSNAGYDEIYFNLAVIQRRQGETRAALDALKVSAFINPLSPGVYSAMAEIFLKDGPKYAREGAEVFEAAAAVYPEDPAIANTLGYFYTQNGDYAKARDVYARGVRAVPGNAALGENLAAVAAKLGKAGDPDLLWLKKFRETQRRLESGDASRAALAAADELVALDRENPNSLSLRARLRFKAGHEKAAREDLVRVLSLRPRDNNARYGLAAIYEKEGDLAAARREWETLLAAEPGNAAVAERLRNLK